ERGEPLHVFGVPRGPCGEREVVRGGDVVMAAHVVEEARLEGQAPALRILLETGADELEPAVGLLHLLREHEGAEDVVLFEFGIELPDDPHDVVDAVEALVTEAVLAVVLNAAKPGEIGRGGLVAERRLPDERPGWVVEELLELAGARRRGRDGAPPPRRRP